jgi:hypothetical protein
MIIIINSHELKRQQRLIYNNIMRVCARMASANDDDND